MSQYENYSDEKLAEHRLEIQVEEDRRAKLEQIPVLVEAYAKDYNNNGGTKKTLIDAITRGFKPEEEVAAEELVGEIEPSE